MLEAGRRNGELKRGLLAVVIVQAVDQAAGKAVAAADTVDDVADLVALGLIELLAVVEAGSPAVPVGALALAQSDGDHLHVRVLCKDLVAESLVLAAVKLTGLDVDVNGDLEGLLNVLLVCDGNIDILCDLTHDLGGTDAVLPEVLAVVEVAGHGDAALLCFLDGLEGKLLCALADSRGDAGDVEPIDALKGLVPVDVAGLGKRDGGILTVVHDLAGQLVCARLEVVYTHAAGTADDAAGVHAELAQLLDAFVGNGILRQNGQIAGIHAVVCQRDCDVCLAAAEGGLEHRGLEEALLSGSLESEHYFAKSKNLHLINPPIISEEDARQSRRSHS